jgi:hypothetical protein
MLVGRCSSPLSGHENDEKSEKSQPPTGANLDFLPRNTGQAAYAPSFKKRRMMFANATNLYRKSGVAERRDLQFRRPFMEMFFGRDYIS